MSHFLDLSKFIGILLIVADTLNCQETTIDGLNIPQIQTTLQPFSIADQINNDPNVQNTQDKEQLNCMAIICNFERGFILAQFFSFLDDFIRFFIGNLCSYQNSQLDMEDANRWQPFKVYSSRHRNLATGVRSAGY